jgi:acyl transferase domain-containing protein/NADP-dependent 3-hydroxy acid dehydrogenase YdfG
MFPQAETLARYWANIRNCVDAITEVPESHWKLADYYDRDPRAPDRTYAHRGGFLTPVDFPLLDFGISPHLIDATDTAQLLGLLVARAALDDAGYPFDGDLNRDRISVILGVTGTLELVIPLGARLGHPIWREALKAAGVDERTSEDVVERIASSYVDWQENSFPGLLGNVAAGRIANRLDLRGTNCVVDAACASSLAALNLAMLELAANRCDIALTGGLDAFNDIFMFMCFSKTPALSQTGDARPFDSQADGTVLGEGLAVVVLKRLEDARRDNDRIYAVIRSIGTSSDGIGQAVYAPSSAGQASALAAAYRSAGISPATVELVEAHGTGTKVGDGAELAALEEVYRGTAAPGSWCALGSVKSQVGHTKAAAGAAGMIKAALALHHKVLPPTIKVSRPIDPILRGDSPFYVSTSPRPWLPKPGHPRRAAVSAFGFGGSNFHCILEEADPEKPGIDWDGDVQILGFSADDPGELTAALRALDGRPSWDEVRDVAAVSRSRFDAQARYRALLVARRDGTDMASLASEALARLEVLSKSNEPEASGRPADYGPPHSGRVFVGLGERPGSLAMLFPGQGSQYPGMLRELACQFPRMQSALSLFNRAFGKLDAPLSDWIYPRPAFDETTRLAQEAALRDTRIAQAAIGAVSLGLMTILDDFGVRPELAGGHSFGELCALCAGGRIDEGELAYLACRRGKLMADCARGGESGAMLAVFTTRDDLEGLLRAAALDLVVANRNAPRQHVLAGDSAEIERARELCAERRIATHPVAVSAAFHSRFVAPARDAFLEVLQPISPRGATIPVFANASASPYPDDASVLRELLASQLAESVDFVAQVEEMYRLGARAFVEVGPDTKLSGLVSSILEGREHAAVAIDRSRGAAGNVYDLACLLASLAALGYPVDLDRWDSAPAARAHSRKPRGLTAKISGANVKPKIPTTGDRSANHRPTPTEPATPLPSPAATSPSRFSIGASLDSLPPADFEPCKNGSIEATLDLSNRMNPQRPNNDQAAHRIGAPSPDEASAGANAKPPATAAAATPDVLRAFQAAQENLLGLQRLAAQTADVHRQFLEGQERIQQTFLKLLDQEQRVARELDHSEQRVARLDGVPPLGERQSAGSFDANSSPTFLASGDSPVRNGAMAHSFPAAPVAPAKPKLPGAEPDQNVALDPDSVSRIVIEVVSDKTGYPPEVLGLDMKLDVDLGIDSIKRVEILSALHDRLPDLPALAPDQVGALGTLRAIAELLNSAGRIRQRRTAVDHPPRTSEYQFARPGNHAQSEAGATIAASADGARIASVLLETVAEKTGYPLDMLELDMKLDADLGIDSIKRVEILSAIQDRIPGLPTLKPEQLGTLRTLREIAAALADRGVSDHLDGSKRAGDGRCEAQPVCEAVDRFHSESALDRYSPSTNGSIEADGVVQHPAEWRVGHGGPDSNGSVASGKVVLVVQHPRPFPLSDTEKRQDIRLPLGGRIWVTDDGSDLSKSMCRRLETLGYRAQLLALGEPIATADNEILSGLIIVAPRHPGDGFIGEAFRTLRAAGPALERSARTGNASLLTVSRLDGRFGVTGLGAQIDPASGALAGLAKTAAHEWTGVDCKALDLDPAIDDPTVAASLIVEELRKRGPAEVGLTARARFGLELTPVSPGAAAAGRRRSPAPGDLVVISGGARGVTAAVAVAMAEAFQPRLALIGRSPAPGLEDPILSSLTTVADLKRGLLERSRRRLAPSELGEQVRQILAAREVRKTISRIEAAGSPVSYHSVDVRDGSAVRDTLRRIRAEHGPIRGLIHGAGALADRRITDQTDEQFNLVYETKVKGFENLLREVDLELLNWLFLFSSSTARFGRTGQVAYAAANEVLNKWAQRLSVQLPGCHVVSFNWGPWNGGMVTDQLKPVFEREGIALIPQADGAQRVVREFERLDSQPAEIVVFAQTQSGAETSSCPIPGGRASVRAGLQQSSDGQSLSDALGAGLLRPEETLGVPPHSARPEVSKSRTGLSDIDRAPASLTNVAYDSAVPPARLTRNNIPAPVKPLDTVFHREVSLEALPVLASHVIDGHAVLPMALVLEWLAEGAAQRNPGLIVAGIDDMKLYKGVILNGASSIPVEIRAGKAVRAGAEFRVAVEMCGTLPGGREAPLARADVVLAARRGIGSPRLFHRTAEIYPHSRSEIYRSLLFHGPAMQGIERVDACNQHGISGWARTSPLPAEWVQRPTRASWLIDPLAIDCAFQFVVLWCRKHLGANSLPTAFGGYRQYQDRFPADGIRVVAEIREATENRAVANVEFLDAADDLVARLEGYECVVDHSLNQAFQRNELMGAAEARLEAGVSID